MLQVARLAPAVLGEDATGLIREFIWKHHNKDGGFSDRDENSDLYYTSFAIDSLTALSEPLPETALKGFLSGKLAEVESLDFVHLCCLARCASALKDEKIPVEDLKPVWDGIEKYRTDDGGYNQAEKMATGSAYACFLAYGAYADHQLKVPDSDGIKTCLESLKQESGAWANDTFLPVANVPATAAAVTLCRNLQIPIPPETGPWILEKCYHKISGGILPFPEAPLPDLLSTAVALHALDGLQIDFGRRKDTMLDFIDSLWTNEGGFHGSWEDDDLDVEYTYYGLLALGHLAL